MAELLERHNVSCNSVNGKCKWSETMHMKMYAFVVLIVIIGLGVVAVPTGLLASALTKTIKDETL